MPVTQNISPELGFHYAKWTGRLSLGELAKGYAEYTALPGVEQTTRSLNDLRQIDALEVYPGGLSALAEVIDRDMAEYTAPHRAVFLLPEDRALSDILSFAEHLNARSGMSVRVLRDLAAALDWLGLPADLKPETMIPR